MSPLKNNALHRCLALDYGDKRIGVAISDEEQTVAFPREVIENGGWEDVLTFLKALINEEKIGTVIVGWPLNMKGEPTAQTQRTAAFIDFLSSQLDVNIVKMDERLTTRQAERSGGGDDVAAQILLQTYLDGRS